MPSVELDGTDTQVCMTRGPRAAAADEILYISTCDCDYMLYCIIISIYFSVSFLCVSRLDDERQAIGAQFEMLALVLFLLMPAITPSRGSLYFILGEMLCHDAHNSNRIRRRKKRGATTPFGQCISTKEQEKPFTPAKVAPIQYSPPPC